MKKFIQIILFYFLVVECLQAQEWVNISPSSDNVSNFYSGFFVNEYEGWLENINPGAIWHTSNGGIDWQKQIESNNDFFGDLQFIDPLHGWVIGQIKSSPNEYYILRTIDGGRNWQKYLTPEIRCITFLDSLNGFAGYHSVYATTDGGITWNQQVITPNIGVIVTDIFFVNKKLGWAVGDNWNVTDAGIVLKTLDGGKTWQFNDSITTVGYTVYFTDSLHGYIPGSNWGGGIKTTSDGGKSWEMHYLPCSWIDDVVFVNDSTGWAVGTEGLIWKTTDIGTTWNKVESGTTSYFHRIFFFNNGEVGYIIGHKSTLLKYGKTVGVKDGNQPLESSFDLFQNYPNPFNPSTVISYQLPVAGHVSLKVFDLLGREAATLIDSYQQAGRYSIQLLANSYHLTSGIYFYRLTAGSYSLTHKMILLR